MRYPDFLCIGVQKSGTTWLFHKLRNHPQVFIPFLKEVHYFDSLYLERYQSVGFDYLVNKTLATAFWHKSYKTNSSDYILEQKISTYLNPITYSDKWYSTFFNEAKPHQLCGDFTPEYSLLNLNAIKHILSLNPNVKVILLLRNPIFRDFSAAKMYLSKNNSKFIKSLSDSELEKVLLMYLQHPDIGIRSNYIEIINKWLSYVPQDNFKIFYYSDIVNRPRQLLRGICSFLKIDYSHSIFENLEEVINPGINFAITKTLYKFLEKKHKKTINLFNYIRGTEW